MRQHTFLRQILPVKYMQKILVMNYYGYCYYKINILEDSREFGNFYLRKGEIKESSLYVMNRSDYLIINNRNILYVIFSLVKKF